MTLSQSSLYLALVAPLIPDASHSMMLAQLPLLPCDSIWLELSQGTLQCLYLCLNNSWLEVWVTWIWLMGPKWCFYTFTANLGKQGIWHEICLLHYSNKLWIGFPYWNSIVSMGYFSTESWQNTNLVESSWCVKLETKLECLPWDFEENKRLINYYL